MDEGVALSGSLDSSEDPPSATMSLNIDPTNITVGNYSIDIILADQNEVSPMF